MLAAWLLAIALGVGHPFWAAVTVAALMPALASPDVWRRTLHLMLGTLGGVGVATFLFSFNPGHLALIAIIIVCQAAAEIVVSRNYGVALLFFSPLAIGMSNLSRGAALAAGAGRPADRSGARHGRRFPHDLRGTQDPQGFLSEQAARLRPYAGA